MDWAVEVMIYGTAIDKLPIDAASTVDPLTAAP